MNTDNRFERGLARLQEISPEAHRLLQQRLNGIAPDFLRYLIEFVMGDLYCRPGLDLRSREIAAIASLVTLSSAAPQLEMHIRGALRIGCTQQEILEVILQAAAFAGFPAALNALAIAEKCFTPPPED